MRTTKRHFYEAIFIAVLLLVTGFAAGYFVATAELSAHVREQLKRP